MSEPIHIQNGRVEATKLTESDVKTILFNKISYIFDWQSSDSLDGWLYNIANTGGTFGNFYGWWDTGSKTKSTIDVKLADKRIYKFKKSDLFSNRTVQGTLL